MTPLSELLKQKAELERQIAEVQREQRASAIAEVKALMNAHGLTLADLAGESVKSRSTKKAGGAVPAKYRDASGNTWSGRGLKPRWLTAALAEGKALADFAV